MLSKITYKEGLPKFLMEELLGCVWHPDKTVEPRLARRIKKLEADAFLLDAPRECSPQDEEKRLLAGGQIDDLFANSVTADSGTPGAADDTEEVRALFRNRAWNLSLNPAKNLGPSVFMIYMMGGGIFGLMFLGFSMLNAVKTLLSVNKLFDDFEKASKVRGSTVLQRIAYCLINVAFIGYFAYRANSTGIIKFGDSSADHLLLRPQDPAADLPLVL